MPNIVFTLRAFAVISLLSILSVAQAVAADEKPIIIVKDTITRIMKTLADDSLSTEAARKQGGSKIARCESRTPCIFLIVDNNRIRKSYPYRLVALQP